MAIASYTLMFYCTSSVNSLITENSFELNFLTFLIHRSLFTYIKDDIYYSLLTY